MGGKMHEQKHSGESDSTMKSTRSQRRKSGRSFNEQLMDAITALEYKMLDRFMFVESQLGYMFHAMANADWQRQDCSNSQPEVREKVQTIEIPRYQFKFKDVPVDASSWAAPSGLTIESVEVERQANVSTSCDIATNTELDIAFAEVQTDMFPTIRTATDAYDFSAIEKVKLATTGTWEPLDEWKIQIGDVVRSRCETESCNGPVQIPSDAYGVVRKIGHSSDDEGDLMVFMPEVVPNRPGEHWVVPDDMLVFRPVVREEEVVLEERAASEEEAIAEPEAVSDGDETMAAKKKKKRKKKPKATDHQHPEETSSMDPEQQAEIQRVVAEAMEKAMSKWCEKNF